MRTSFVRKNKESDVNGVETTLGLHLDFVNRRYFCDYPDSGVMVVLGIPAIVQHNGSSSIPAAELIPSTGTIVVNRALPKLRCPLYVYRYLIFHERLHQIYPPKPGDPVHSEEFRDHEMRAPHRLKAIRWLKKHAFPVMDR